MEKVILIRLGELFLKGNNRKFFENFAFKNLKKALVSYQLNVQKIDGRFVISNYNILDEKEILSVSKKVFGLYSLSIADVIDSEDIKIFDKLKEIAGTIKGTFKIETKRADKNFPHTSMDFNKLCGGVILDANKSLKVNVLKPDNLIKIDIRLNKKAYIFSQTHICAGGLPVGTAGRALSLLSGGIDSPVASVLAAKRGLSISYLHFESYPYTSQQAFDKVMCLAKAIKPYTFGAHLYSVSLKEVQEEIHKNCDDSYMIILMRRIMMRVTAKICKLYKYGAIITGENLGQVASQTIENMTASNITAENTIVLRPLISFDKEEIIYKAKEYGTFETSILPYEDCCTAFLPKSPIIKGNLKLIEQEEKKIDVDKLVQNCLAGLKKYSI